jgi:dihydroxy-acid dehydratase
MYTANTMSSSFEALGMSLLGSSQMASPDPEKADSARHRREGAGQCDPEGHEAARHHHAQVDRERGRADHGDRRLDQRGAALPRDRARGAEVKWTIDDFERVRRKVPVLCDLKPSGRYVATDFHRAGGVPQVLKMLLATACCTATA